MYDRNVDGQVLEFGVSGKLWKNALIMYDRQTGSYWSHITGEALEGKLKGRKVLPVTNMQVIPRVSFLAWASQHPQTKVLSINGRTRGPNRYASYLRQGKFVGIGTSQPVADRRLPHRDLVLGIKLKNSARAYPVKGFKSRPLIQDSNSPGGLLIYHDTKSGAAAAYLASVDGQSLEFEPKVTDFRMKDKTTGSTWHLLTGKAESGTLRGKTLSPVPVMEIFWGAWADFYPDTYLYGQK